MSVLYDINGHSFVWLKIKWLCYQMSISAYGVSITTFPTTLVMFKETHVHKMAR